MWFRGVVAWAVVLAVTVGFGAIAALGQAGERGADDQLFDVDGISAPIIAQEPVTAIDAGSVLLLERIELPPSATLPARTTTSPELYLVQRGAFSLQDAFGFGTTIPAGDSLSLKTGTAITAGNGGNEPATVLRLRIVAGDAVSDEPTAPDATPTNQTGVETTVLIEIPLEGTPQDAGRLFMGRAVFAPGAATGPLNHAGPVGIHVESGTLSIASPSGFQGTVDADQSVVLPADTPLQANATDAEAVVLLVGIGATDGVFADSPVVTPTVTLVASGSIPQASPVVAGATPAVFSLPGQLLQMGETWQVAGASLYVKIGEFSEDGIRITFIYRNLSDARVDFTIPSGYVDVHDDLRNPWKPVAGGAYTGMRVILEPDDTFEGGWWWMPENVDLEKHSANVFVTFRNFGEVPSATWGFTVASGKILTIPPDAIDPAT